MKKRLTAAQRKRQQIKALEQRLTDIYSGAFGGEFVVNENFPCARELSKIVPAVADVFNLRDEKEHLAGPHVLSQYDCPKALAEFLYEYGVRA